MDFLCHILSCISFLHLRVFPHLLLIFFTPVCISLSSPSPSSHSMSNEESAHSSDTMRHLSGNIHLAAVFPPEWKCHGHLGNLCYDQIMQQGNKQWIVLTDTHLMDGTEGVSEGDNEQKTGKHLREGVTETFDDVMEKSLGRRLGLGSANSERWELKKPWHALLVPHSVQTCALAPVREQSSRSTAKFCSATHVAWLNATVLYHVIFAISVQVSSVHRVPFTRWTQKTVGSLWQACWPVSHEEDHKYYSQYCYSCGRSTPQTSMLNGTVFVGAQRSNCT